MTKNARSTAPPSRSATSIPTLTMTGRAHPSPGPALIRGIPTRSAGVGSYWPEGVAEEYGTPNNCTYGTVRNSDTYDIPLHPDWRYTTTVKARWCYHYRSHVSAVQTIKRSATTESLLPYVAAPVF